MSSYKVHNKDDAPTPQFPYSRKQYIDSHAGDPYPGTSNITEILSVRLNNSTLQKPIYQIIERPDSVITFNFLRKDIPAGIATLIEEKNNTTDNRVFTIDGRFVGTTTKGLPKGVYIVNKKKIIVR